MSNKRLPVFELTIFCLVTVVFYIMGLLFFCQNSSNTMNSHWLYVGFQVVFIVALLSLLLFLRRILVSKNLEIAEKKAIQKNYLEQLNNTYEGTLKALSYALDLRDHGTWGHSARVVSYALAIAEKIGLTQQALRQLAWAGILHDIGKIGVPDSILLKKTALDPDEWENVKRHPTIGYEVIREIDFLKFAADIVLCHHEHYDGSGYPKGIKGEYIPLGARIFAIADALDAMTSDR
ncbi:MAG TPA: hypothetical protein DDW65_08815, partial [Firmicutes bacterium]|nr:hypothetical protein [Bacillota bacterium]